MAEADLVIAGGTVVTPDGRRRANVTVAGGQIVDVSSQRPDAREVVVRWEVHDGTVLRDFIRSSLPSRCRL